MILKTKTGPLYFETAGEGLPLVFTSGWAMSCECWRPTVALLQHKYRCLIYDSRGIGRSQPASVSAAFEIEDHTEDLHSILAAAAIYDAVLIGHEIGALVAAMCADRHPQHVQSLAVVSPRSGMLEDDIRKLSLFTPASLALRELGAYPILRNLVAWRFRRAPQPYRKTLFEDFANLNPRAAYETALSAASLDSSAHLEGLVEQAPFPVLTVCGERDRKSINLSRKLFSRVRAGRLATMSDCGFLPMLEYPRQFGRLLEDFVAGYTRSGVQALRRQ